MMMIQAPRVRLQEGRGLVILITGKPRTGKTTLAYELFKALHVENSDLSIAHITGSNLRSGVAIAPEHNVNTRLSVGGAGDTTYDLQNPDLAHLRAALKPVTRFVAEGGVAIIDRALPLRAQRTAFFSCFTEEGVAEVLWVYLRAENETIWRARFPSEPSETIREYILRHEEPRTGAERTPDLVFDTTATSVPGEVAETFKVLLDKNLLVRAGGELTTSSALVTNEVGPIQETAVAVATAKDDGAALVSKITGAIEAVLRDRGIKKVERQQHGEREILVVEGVTLTTFTILRIVIDSHYVSAPIDSWFCYIRCELDVHIQEAKVDNYARFLQWLLRKNLAAGPAPHFGLGDRNQLYWSVDMAMPAGLASFDSSWFSRLLDVHLALLVERYPSLMRRLYAVPLEKGSLDLTELRGALAEVTAQDELTPERLKELLAAAAPREVESGDPRAAEAHQEFESALRASEQARRTKEGG